MHDVTEKGLTDVRVDSSDLEEVRRLVFAGLRGYRARVYLFGSWATGNAGRTSDIDVAILPLEPVPPVVSSESWYSLHIRRCQAWREHGGDKAVERFIQSLTGCTFGAEP